MIEKGEIGIIGAKHDLDTGVIEFYDDTWASNKAEVKAQIAAK